MKSFADWTQELAESVGEVKHHWEKTSLDEELDNIFGSSQQKFSPEGSMASAYDKCDYCNRESYLFPYTSTTGHTKQICKACLDQVYGP